MFSMAVWYHIIAILNIGFSSCYCVFISSYIFYILVHIQNIIKHYDTICSLIYKLIITCPWSKVLILNLMIYFITRLNELIIFSFKKWTFQWHKRCWPLLVLRLGHMSLVRNLVVPAWEGCVVLIVTGFVGKWLYNGFVCMTSELLTTIAL